MDKPILRHLLVCNRTLFDEATNSLNCYGLIEGVFFPRAELKSGGFPVHPLVILSTHIFSRTEHYEMKLKIISPSGKMIKEENMEVGKIGEKFHNEHELRVFFNIEEQGVYWFRVYFEGLLFAQTSMAVQFVHFGSHSAGLN